MIWLNVRPGSKYTMAAWQPIIILHKGMHKWWPYCFRSSLSNMFHTIKEKIFCLCCRFSDVPLMSDKETCCKSTDMSASSTFYTFLSTQCMLKHTLKFKIKLPVASPRGSSQFCFFRSWSKQVQKSELKELGHRLNVKVIN